MFITYLLFLDSMNSPIKRREFFEKYAKEEGFDPLNAEKWYSQSTDNIIARKVIQSNNTLLVILLY